MNLKPLIKLKLDEFFTEFPNYTYGNILYCMLNVKYKSCDFTKGDLFSLSDEEFYELLCKALVRERHDKEEIEC